MKGDSHEVKGDPDEVAAAGAGSPSFAVARSIAPFRTRSFVECGTKVCAVAHTACARNNFTRRLRVSRHCDF
jgi:hypothetical protein